ncbi:WGxxGxxG family protein [Paenisporosarcina quisquiliarum]|uniref:WGxxGxxG family protein n=1 Tax=Paenisporosarcina quisquiliarum TaxID=365346 RepID=UPI0037358165
MLKKITAFFLVIVCTFTVLGTTTFASPDTGNGNNINENAAAGTAADDDGMDWGWIGLIGLAGLMGLKRKDDRRD